MTTNKIAFAATTLILVIVFLLAEVGLRIYQRVAGDIQFAGIPHSRPDRSEV